MVEFEAGRKSFDNLMQLGFFLEDLFHRRVELITPNLCAPTSDPISSTRSNMSLSPIEYLRHILDETESLERIDYDIVWDVVATKTPSLRQMIREIIAVESGQP